MANELECRYLRLSCERVLEGGELHMFERCQELITEGSVHILALVLFPELFLVFPEEFFS